MEYKGISKQRLVYTILCVLTIIVFVLTFSYTDFDLNTFSSKMHRMVVPSDGPVVVSTVSQLTASNDNAKGKPETEELLTSMQPPTTSTRKTTPTTSSRSTTTKPSKPQSGANDLPYPPSFLSPKVLATLTLEQLREESLKYDLSTFPVPKVIHQSWKVEKLPPRFKKWSATWKACFPGWKYRMWTDEENHDFVKNTFPWFNDRYRRLISSVQKADAVRYLYLFVYGGIYADLDDECLKPFPHLLQGHPIIFGAMEGAWFGKGATARLEEGYVQNSFMYSVAGHPLWLDVIETIMKRPNSHSAEGTTGPFMLQEVIGLWRRRMVKPHHNVTIYAPKYFNPFSWIKRKFPACKDVNGMSSADIKNCKANFPDSYVIQYHTQTWGRGAGRTNRNDRRKRI